MTLSPSSYAALQTAAEPWPSRRRRERSGKRGRSPEHAGAGPGATQSDKREGHALPNDRPRRQRRTPTQSPPASSATARGRQHELLKDTHLAHDNEKLRHHEEEMGWGGHNDGTEELLQSVGLRPKPEPEAKPEPSEAELTAAAWAKAIEGVEDPEELEELQAEITSLLEDDLEAEPDEKLFSGSAPEKLDLATRYSRAIGASINEDWSNVAHQFRGLPAEELNRFVESQLSEGEAEEFAHWAGREMYRLAAEEQARFESRARGGCWRSYPELTEGQGRQLLESALQCGEFEVNPDNVRGGFIGAAARANREFDRAGSRAVVPRRVPEGDGAVSTTTSTGASAIPGSRGRSWSRTLPAP